jgi:hypothetical protein
MGGAAARLPLVSIGSGFILFPPVYKKVVQVLSSSFIWDTQLN